MLRVSRFMREPAFLSKLRQQKTEQTTAFSVPSVLLSNEFIDMVSAFCKKHQGSRSSASAGGPSRRPFSMAAVARDLEPLLSDSLIKEELVRLDLLNTDRKYHYAPMVPFRVARDLVLKHIKDPIAQEAFRTQYFKYREDDLYAQPALFKSGPRRTPSVCIMGHIDHGKTTLLDTLQSSRIADTEAGKITQSIRAFTVRFSTHDYPAEMSFVDTPGHKLFAELRLTGQHAVDYVLLIVALDEGVQGQTEEVVKVALHLKKPVVVAFNKVDLFDDPSRLSYAISTATLQLRKLGLSVRLIDSQQSLDALMVAGRDSKLSVSDDDGGSGTMTPPPGTDQCEFDKYCDGVPRAVTAAAMNDGNKPTTGKKRKSRLAGINNEVRVPGAVTSDTEVAKAGEALFALGVCISGRNNDHVPLLLQCLRSMALHRSPVGDRHSNPAQAVILESFKDTKAVVISCLVRNGTLTVGMPFLADHTNGEVTRLTDQFGSKLQHVLPGQVCNMYGAASDGCPGPGTHVMQMPSLAQAQKVSAFRGLLQKFLEKHAKHAHLLRPEGMNTSFMHVGNFGQVDDKSSFDYNLLFKTPAAEPATSTGVEEQWIASQLSNDEQPKSEEEAIENLKKTKPVTVLLKVDSWHSARLLTREIPRLGTRDVTFAVVSAGFGVVTENEVNNLTMLNIILNFRAPKLTCGKTGFALDFRKITYKECDVYTDVIEFFKKYAVDKQREITLARDARLEKLKSDGDVILESNGVPSVKPKRLHGPQKLSKRSGVDVE